MFRASQRRLGSDGGLRRPQSLAMNSSKAFIHVWLFDPRVSKPKVGGDDRVSGFSPQVASLKHAASGLCKQL